MDESRNVLNKYASSKSKYFQAPDGEEIKVKFLYAEEIPNHFDGGNTNCIRYHLEVNGIEQLWDRTSRNLAQQMSKVFEGDLISIKRTGEKSKTKYFIRKIEE